MSDKLDPCCQRALNRWVARIHETVVSYPVIQDRPCPACRKIVKVRVYNPPVEVGTLPRSPTSPITADLDRDDVV